MPYRRPYAKRQTTGRAFGEDVTLLRDAAGHRDTTTGRWVPGSTSQTAMRMATAPIRAGQERVVEIGGARHAGQRKFWSPEELFALTADADGDRIVWNNQTWQVIFVGQWDGQLHEAETKLVAAPAGV